MVTFFTFQEGEYCKAKKKKNFVFSFVFGTEVEELIGKSLRVRIRLKFELF